MEEAEGRGWTKLFPKATAPGIRNATSNDASSHRVAQSAGYRRSRGPRRDGLLPVCRVAKVHVFPSTSVPDGDGGRSLRIEIPSHYGGRRRDWDYDSTSVCRGRLVLVVGTLTAEPFQQVNLASRDRTAAEQRVAWRALAPLWPRLPALLDGEDDHRGDLPP